MDIPDDKVTTDLIIGWLKGKVESHKIIPKELWMDAAFKLNLLQPDEFHDAEVWRQTVAQEKLKIMMLQKKRNVAAATLEIEASDNYRFLREQENKVDRIEEFIRIAKKNSESNY